MSAVLSLPAMHGGPFDLADDDAYRRWRDVKLADYPRTVDELVVEVRDPRHLSRAEHAAIAARLTRANMAVYASPLRDHDHAIVRDLGRQFGLRRLDNHWLADDDGVSRITAVADDERPRGEFIPYTDRPIRWHTDGYYNPAVRRIRAMILHCVQDAAAGGGNGLLDHEIAYIHLRDAAREHVAALMDDVMTIPARADAHGVARAAESGPVFEVDAASARLHMRYTARTVSIQWRDDAATRAALACLEAFLASDSAPVLRTRLAPGMGLICANVLHDRSGFTDDPQRPRLLLRGRFYDCLDLGLR